VTSTAAIGECLTPSRGCSAAVDQICCLISGEAFSSSQRSPSAETAMLDWLRGRT